MKEVFGHYGVLALMIQHRPPEYQKELESCITRRTPNGVFLDVECPAYLKLQQKYKPLAGDKDCPGCGEP